MTHPQRQSPRAPLHLKSTGSPKLEDRRSPRSPLQEKKKKESIVAKLEIKLGQAQEELKKLKEQLSAAEAANPNKCFSLPLMNPEVEEKEKPMNMEDEALLLVEKNTPLPTEEEVFEVALACIQGERSTLEEKERSKEEMGTAEITDLKKEIENAKNDIFEWRLKGEECAAKLCEAEEELSKAKTTVERLRERLESEETMKASMDAEMKRLRIQTEQWRKAAEAAAAVLDAGDGFVNDGVLNGKRHHSGGMRVLGELWKKKGLLNK